MERSNSVYLSALLERILIRVLEEINVCLELQVSLSASRGEHSHQDKEVVNRDPIISLRIISFVHLSKLRLAAPTFSLDESLKKQFGHYWSTRSHSGFRGSCLATYNLPTSSSLRGLQLYFVELYSLEYCQNTLYTTYF